MVSHRIAQKGALLAIAGVMAISLAACSGATTPAETAAPETDAAGSEFVLVSDGKLTVATEGTYKPFSFHDDSGDLVGYDVEVAEAVAEKLGLEIEFQETQWDAIFAGLEAGRFDTIANQVSITPEREEKYIFSTPYTVSSGVIVVRDDNDTISSFEDLAGKTTAQSLTSNWYELATESGANVEAVEGWAQAIALLEQSRVDATINDQLTYLDYAANNPDAAIKVAAETEETSESAFVVTKKNEALAAAISDALAELQSEGVLAEIGEKYFGADVSQ